MNHPASICAAHIPVWRSRFPNRAGIAMLCCLAFLPYTLVAAQGEENAPKPHLRKAILQDFPYDPSVRATSLEQASPAPSSQGEIDPEVILMPEFEVQSRPLDRSLTQAIENSRPIGPPKSRKFGTGVISKDFGKVRASVVTILYVPIHFGISW